MKHFIYLNTDILNSYLSQINDGIINKVQSETYDGLFYDAKWMIDKIGKLCDYILFDCAWGGFEQFVPIMNHLSPLNLDFGPDDPGS